MAQKTGKHYINAARNCPTITTKNGRGDHVKAYGYDLNGNWTATVIPENLKGNGTEYSIRKWLLRFGIVATLVVGTIIYFG